MKKLWQLMWLQIKLNLNLPQLKRNFKSGKGILKNIFGIGVFAILIAGILGTYVFLLDMLFDVALKVNMASTVISLTIFMGMVLVLVYGIFRNIGLYYSKDTEFLASLPIPKRTVYAAKFIVSYLGEIGIFAALVLPPIIILGIKTSPGLLFWFKGIVVCLLGPMAPFALASLLAAGLMRLSLFARHRDKIMTIGGFLLLIVYIVFMQVLGQVMNHIDSEAIMAFLTGRMIEVIGQIFPPSIWASHMMMYAGSTGLIAFLKFTGTSLAGLLVSIYTAGSAFSRGAVGQTETARKSKRIDMSRAASDSRSPLWCIFAKEWKIVLRVPVYAMNSLIQVIMSPLMIVLMFLIPTMSGDGDDASMTMLVDLVREPGAGPIFILAAGALIYFMGSLNTGGSTAFSREGQASWLMQTMPVKATTIALGKLLFALSILLLTCVASWVSLTVVFKNPLTSALACVFAFICGVPVVTLGNNIDMYRPRLKWDSEQRAMKSNSNSFLAVLFTFLYIIGAGFLTYFLFSKLDFSMEAVLWTITGISIVLSVVFFMMMQKTAQKAINAMGDSD